MLRKLKQWIKDWIRTEILEDKTKDDRFLEVIVKDKDGTHRRKIVQPLSACGIYLRCTLVDATGPNELIVHPRQAADPEKFQRIWKRMLGDVGIDWE